MRKSLLLGLLLLMLGIYRTYAQATFEILCPTRPTLLPEYPSSPFGSIFHVLDWYLPGNPPLQLRQVANQGTYISTNINLPDNIGKYYPLAVSPNGKYLVFLPNAEDANLVVWNIQTAQLASFALTPEQSIYFDSSRDVSLEIVRNRIVWESNSTLLLSYQTYVSDVPTLIRQQRIVVEENPFSLIEQTSTTIEYPNFPLPNDNPLVAKSKSPLGTIVVITSLERVRLANGQAVDFADYSQFYNVNTNQPILDLTPNPNRGYYNLPDWTPDGQSFFMRYFDLDRNRNYYLTRFHITANGFVEDTSLQDRLFQVFGDVHLDSDLSVSPDGNWLAFKVWKSDFTRSYLIAYNLNTSDIKATCFPVNEAPYQYSLSDNHIPIWSPDSRYMGWSSGNFFYFDLNTGDMYEIPRQTHEGVFVGWLPIENSVINSITQRYFTSNRQCRSTIGRNR
jgi:hypothetical protein